MCGSLSLFRVQDTYWYENHGPNIMIITYHDHYYSTQYIYYIIVSTKALLVPRYIKYTTHCKKKNLYGRLTNMCSECSIIIGNKKEWKGESSQSCHKFLSYRMGTNFSGWGYPLSQTLSFLSCLSDIVVDVNPFLDSSPSVNGVFAGIWKYRSKSILFLLVLRSPDDDDAAVDPSNIEL